jgi:hypothetical protein
MPRQNSEGDEDGDGSRAKPLAASTETARFSLPVHPYCDTFPLMSDRRELADDISVNGLTEPIVVHEGQIVDGRNRFLACIEAGVEPRYVEWAAIYDGPMSTESWIWSKNVQRRHLTPEQIATAYVIAEQWGLRQQASLAQADGRRLGGQTAGRGRPKGDSLLAISPASNASEVGSGPDENPRAQVDVEPKGHSTGRRRRVMEECGVTDYIAKQVLEVERGAPELLREVAQGKAKLCRAAKTARTQILAKAVGPGSASADNPATAPEAHRLSEDRLERLIKRAVRAVEKILAEVPEEQQHKFKAEVTQTVLRLA